MRNGGLDCTYLLNSMGCSTYFSEVQFFFPGSGHLAVYQFLVVIEPVLDHGLIITRKYPMEQRYRLSTLFIFFNASLTAIYWRNRRHHVCTVCVPSHLEDWQNSIGEAEDHVTSRSNNQYFTCVSLPGHGMLHGAVGVDDAKNGSRSSNLTQVQTPPFSRATWRMTPIKYSLKNQECI